MQFVGVVLVHNEDVFVEQAIRNVAGFCDRIHAVDHVSTDRTPEILHRLAGELDHVTVVRSSDAGDSHRAIEAYAGTPTWVLGVDGDELYDPSALALSARSSRAGPTPTCSVSRDTCSTATSSTRRRQSPAAISPRRPARSPSSSTWQRWTAGRGVSSASTTATPAFRRGYGWDSLRYTSEGTRLGVGSASHAAHLLPSALERGCERRRSGAPRAPRDRRLSERVERTAAQTPPPAAHRPANQGVPARRARAGSESGMRAVPS